MNRFLGSLVERFSDLTDLREELCRFQNEFSGAKPKSPDLQRQSGERAGNFKCRHYIILMRTDPSVYLLF